MKTKEIKITKSLSPEGGVRYDLYIGSMHQAYVTGRKRYIITAMRNRRARWDAILTIMWPRRIIEFPNQVDNPKKMLEGLAEMPETVGLPLNWPNH